MSLGFDRAGFRPIAAVEVNDFARQSHEANFSGKADEGYRSFSDIRSVEPADVVSHAKDLFESPETVADVVIGGPPCQAFSRLGRAALWRLAGKDYAHGEDERASYYLDYLHYVAALKPIAFVMENVREIGKFTGRNIAEEIAVTASDMGYEVRYALLNAVWFGVPQLRERMFIIGIRKELGVVPTFPSIKHKYDLPVGYSTSRAGNGHNEVLEPRDHFVDHFQRSSKLLPAVSLSDAFEDLPPITHHLDGRKGKGAPRDLHKKFDYVCEGNAFTKSMKQWPGFESKEGFYGHVIRYTPRDYETFRRMPAGGMYPDALKVAEEIFEEKLKSLESQLGKKIEKGSEDWERLRKETVPPYRGDRYPNKFRKLWPDHPSRTLPAHIGKDSYSHIHFDSEQARGISLREAARIQSFPDGFKLVGSMNVQLTQIGNAVPPLLAYAVASNLSSVLGKAKVKKQEEQETELG